VAAHKCVVAMNDSNRLKVLITGAYGLIGNLVYAQLAQQPDLYDVHGLVKEAVPSERAEAIAIQTIPSSSAGRTSR